MFIIISTNEDGTPRVIRGKDCEAARRWRWALKTKGKDAKKAEARNLKK